LQFAIDGHQGSKCAVASLLPKTDEGIILLVFIGPSHSLADNQLASSVTSPETPESSKCVMAN
jgi:hypothetical protein